MSAITLLTSEDAQRLSRDHKGKFIDIRTVGEALTGRLPDSVFLPFDLVNREHLEGLGIGDKIPILVCRSGIRAKQAAEALAKEMGNVAVLDGGIVQWQKTGLDYLAGSNTLPIERQVLVAAGAMILLFTVLGLLLSPYFFALTLMMTAGMIFAGITGACGMARILVMMPWNKAPLCGEQCTIPEHS